MKPCPVPPVHITCSSSLRNPKRPHKSIATTKQKAATRLRPMRCTASPRNPKAITDGMSAPRFERHRVSKKMLYSKSRSQDPSRRIIFVLFETQSMKWRLVRSVSISLKNYIVRKKQVQQLIYQGTYLTSSSRLFWNLVRLVLTLANSVSRNVQLLNSTWLINMRRNVQFTKRQLE